MDSSTKDFDATKVLTPTTDFGGIDFKAIRAQYEGQKRPKDIGNITDIWKRQRKSRIKMVEAKGSGYGSAAAPVLISNDYDLETGKRSVFDRELGGRLGSRSSASTKKKSAQPTFESQGFCQCCGDGGLLVCCPRCPVSVHVQCLGLKREKEFQWCSHHNCSECGKNRSHAGGMLFPCSCCPNAYCEDHLPQSARILEECERMEKHGFTIKNGAYIHCSPLCEEVAKEFGWRLQEKKTRDPCPPDLDMSKKFGGKVDDSLDVPDELVVNGKRRRKEETQYIPENKMKRKREKYTLPAVGLLTSLELNPGYYPLLVRTTRIRLFVLQRDSNKIVTTMMFSSLEPDPARYPLLVRTKRIRLVGHQNVLHRIHRLPWLFHRNNRQQRCNQWLVP
jgi:hypothetical protein